MKKILSLLLVSSSIFSMQLDLVKTNKLQEKSSQYNSSHIDCVNKVLINPKAFFAPNRLGSVELYHGKKGFSVRQDDKKHAIQKCFTDPMVRNITTEQLHAFLQAGYLSLNQMNDGEFSLQAKGRINGGGPYLGGFMYWLTKSTCYGIAGVGIGAAAITTAGAGVALVTGTAVAAGGVAVGTAAVTAGTTATIATTAGAITVGAAASTGIVATGAIITGGITTLSGAGVTVAGTSLVGAATLTTAAGVTAVAGTGAAATVGTGAACIMGIEALSVAVGTFFGMLPTP